ncbi:hypothetical protein RKD32_000537 [Streptomyces sp. SAI-195]
MSETPPVERHGAGHREDGGGRRVGPLHAHEPQMAAAVLQRGGREPTRGDVGDQVLVQWDAGPGQQSAGAVLQPDGRVRGAREPGHDAVQVASGRPQVFEQFPRPSRVLTGPGGPLSSAALSARHVGLLLASLHFVPGPGRGRYLMAPCAGPSGVGGGTAPGLSAGAGARA